MKNKDFYIRFFLTILILVIINVIFIISSKHSILGWYLFPINLSGIIIIYELVKYITGQYNLFEPRGLFALVGTHYFFLAPLLFLGFSREMLFVDNPENWGIWVGLFCLLNFVGILVYNFVFNIGKNVLFKPLKTKWIIDKKKFTVVLIFLGSISFAFQMYFLYLQGGISRIVQSKTDQNLDLSGFGWMLMFGESLPILIFFGIYILFMRDRSKKSKKTILIYIILIAFFILQIFVAGLRGSRSTIIFALFWCVTIIHFTYKPFLKRHLIVGIVFVIMFMVIYGYYKNVGADITKVFTQETSIEDLQETNKNRGILNTLVSDVARVDTQSYLLYRLFTNEAEFDLAYGRTYLGDAFILVPSFIVSNPPPGKVKEGTELMYGEGSYPSIVSSRVYGLLGEGLLNFHVFAVPLVFLIWSLFVLNVTRLVYRLSKDDARWLIVPLLIQLTFTSLNSDLDNIIFGIVKTGFVPFLLIFLSSKKIKNEKLLK